MALLTGVAMPLAILQAKLTPPYSSCCSQAAKGDVTACVHSARMSLASMAIYGHLEAGAREAEMTTSRMTYRSMPLQEPIKNS